MLGLTPSARAAAETESQGPSERRGRPPMSCRDRASPHVTRATTGGGTAHRPRSRPRRGRPCGRGSARRRAAPAGGRRKSGAEHAVHRAAQRQRLGDRARRRAVRRPRGGSPPIRRRGSSRPGRRRRARRRATRGRRARARWRAAEGRSGAARAGARELLLEGGHAPRRPSRRAPARCLGHRLDARRHQLLEPLLRRRRGAAALGEPAHQLIELEAAVTARGTHVGHAAGGGPCAQGGGADAEQPGGGRDGQQARALHPRRGPSPPSASLQIDGHSPPIGSDCGPDARMRVQAD